VIAARAPDGRRCAANLAALETFTESKTAYLAPAGTVPEPFAPEQLPP